MIANAFTTVFRDWRYTLLSGVVAVFTFAFATWLPNLKLLFSILTDPLVSVGDKLTLPVNLLGSIATNFSVLSAVYTIAIALLIGINVSLIIYNLKLRQRQFPATGVTAGGLGIVSGIFGIGCAACGSLILMSVFGTAGAAIIAFLPLRGAEFGIIGVVLLGASTYLLAKQITKPLVC